MKYLERKLLQELEKWMERREIMAIKGPRQSGKTTLLEIIREWLIAKKKVSQENIVFITFEDRENLEKFEEDPKGFIKSFIVDEDERYYFLLDEVHYVSNCGQKLKLLYDLFKNIKLIVTGSSSLELTNSTAGFLVGRLFSFELFPFNFYEFLLARDKKLAGIYIERNSRLRGLFDGRDFEVERDIFLKDISRLFDEFVVFGGYPEVIKAKNEEEKRIVLKGIYNTYVERDIISFFRIDDALKFKKLVTMLSSLTA